MGIFRRKGVHSRLIVSVTSYPKRIGFVASALETIFTQTYPADEVVLYLAKEEFPDGEDMLPAQLREMTADGRLVLRWCEDLKPHKKYFYAFRDYPDDIIVTIDDDLLYDPALLETLMASYERFPWAVSAVRVHLMVLERDGSLLPYDQWPRDTDESLDVPSMQLFATGGAGALYPPHLLDPAFLDAQVIRETCLFADDLWLKAMEVMSGVPVVLCRPYQPLSKVPGSQEETLWQTNVNGGRNDEQMLKILSWLDMHYGEGVFLHKLAFPESGEDLQGLKVILHHMYALQMRDKNRLKRQLKKEEDQLRKKEEQIKSARDPQQYLYARMDLKNEGADENDIRILKISDLNAQIQAPAWFCKSGKGYVIKSKEAEIGLTVQCIGSGNLTFALRGPFARSQSGEPVPVWLEYRQLQIDERVIFDQPKQIWHNRPFRYAKEVRDGQIVTVLLKWYAGYAVIRKNGK